MVDVIKKKNQISGFFYLKKDFPFKISYFFKSAHRKISTDTSNGVVEREC